MLVLVNLSKGTNLAIGIKIMSVKVKSGELENTVSKVIEKRGKRMQNN